MTGPLDYRQRCAITGWLDQVARQLNEGAVRFDELGMHAVAGGLDRAARELAAAAWIVWSPVRESAPPPYGPPRWPAEADRRRA